MESSGACNGRLGSPFILHRLGFDPAASSAPFVAYGKSLHVDDANYLAGAHFQNHRVPADEACYTCHTNYAMFGSFKAKLGGLRHLYVHYLNTEPRPEDIKLHEPYNNRECLHCHLGAQIRHGCECMVPPFTTINVSFS